MTGIEPAEPVCRVSWLQLELHALGELPDGERRRVEAHVAGCATCGARVGSVAGDVRPMPALRRPVARARRPVLGWAAPVLLAAALLVVGLALRPPDEEPGSRVKGAGVALTLVRERDGVVVEAPTDYRDGDRFRALLTCPPGAPVVDVVVIQGDEIAYPLDGPFDCGNRVALPGAFRLTGRAPVEVCVVEGSPEAEAPRASACVELAPAAGP